MNKRKILLGCVSAFAALAMTATAATAQGYRHHGYRHHHGGHWGGPAVGLGVGAFAAGVGLGASVAGYPGYAGYDAYASGYGGYDAYASGYGGYDSYGAYGSPGYRGEGTPSGPSSLNFQTGSGWNNGDRRQYGNPNHW